MSESRPSEDDQPLDEPLLASLLELDEAIREGMSPAQVTTHLTEEQRADWEAARLGLAALEAALPRATTNRSFIAPGLPPKLGRFIIEDVVGAGGFAVVYRGRDPYLDRATALKVPRPHALVSADLRERFVRESKAAAALDHPHIVATYEAGEEQGIPYIAYAYCDGPTLAAWLYDRKAPVDPRLAARLLIQLAEGVQFSHAHGVLHRDIKPANVLLFPDPNSPETNFPYLAKLSDFGLAKLMESELEDTGSSILMGTPLYMAPEQTSRQDHDVGPVTDVYGLGTVLYELLTGKTLFEASTPWEALDLVRNREPVHPRQLVPQLPRDIDTICRHCLAKEPKRRYATPALLADDLHCFLKGRPIAAQPVPLWEQALSWCQRNPSIAGLTASTAVAIVAILIGLALYAASLRSFGRELGEKNTQLVKAVNASRDAEKLAQSHANELRETLYTIEVGRAAAAWRKGDMLTMTAALEPFTVIEADEQDLREFGWHYLWKQRQIETLFQTTLPAHQYAAAFTPDGGEVAFAGSDSVVRMFSVPGFQPTREYATSQKEINSLAFGPRAEWMATTGDDGTLAVWSLPDGQEKYRKTLFTTALAFRVVYSEPLNCFVVCGNQSDVYVLEPGTGEIRHVLQGVHQQGVESVGLSHDGLRVITCGVDSRVAIWDLQNAQVLQDWADLPDRLIVAEWSADDRQVIMSLRDHHIIAREVDTGREMSRHLAMDVVRSLATHQNGLIVAGDRGGMISLLPHSLPIDDREQFRPSISWAVLRDRVYGLTISPSGQLVAAGARGGGVAVIRPDLEPPYQRSVLVPDFAFTKDSRVIGPDSSGRVFGISDDGIHVVAASSPDKSTLFHASQNIWALQLHDDQLFAYREPGLLLEWNLSKSSPEPVRSELSQVSQIQQILPLDSTHLLLRGNRTNLLLWNRRTRSVEREWPSVGLIAASADGRWFATAEHTTHRLHVYDAQTLVEQSTVISHTEAVNSLVFDPSGNRLYSGSSDRSVAAWEVPTLREVQRLRGHEAPITAMAAAPGGRVLAATDGQGSTRLWDLQAGRELFELFRSEQPFYDLQFSSDGRQLRGRDLEHAEFRWSIAPTSGR